MSNPRNTSPFFTFDPIIRDPEELVSAIKLSKEGSHVKFLDLVNEDLGMPELIDGVGASLDSATILFVSIIALEYLLRYTKEDKESSFHYYLKLLSRRFNDYFGDYEEISSGMAGVDLLGWLNGNEILELKMEIENGSWSIDSSEELDGGVQDCIRHLLVILRSAIRRNCGILMRKHT